MPDTLSVLSIIMLAQAQEAIYIKAEKGLFLAFFVRRLSKLTKWRRLIMFLYNAVLFSRNWAVFR